jgi:antitoxin FitA
MATLLIRDLDDDVKARLRVQAAQHGRSMEAEARTILAFSLNRGRPTRGLGTYIREQFDGVGGDDLVIATRDDQARAGDLDR